MGRSPSVFKCSVSQEEEGPFHDRKIEMCPLSIMLQDLAWLCTALLVPLALCLVFLVPQLQQQYQSGSSVVAEGRRRRRAKLSFPCSPVILLVPIKFHVASLPGVQGLCDPGWEGCADKKPHNP